MRQSVIPHRTHRVVLLLLRRWLTAQNVRNSLSQTRAECIRADSNPAESMPCYCGNARSWYSYNIAEGFLRTTITHYYQRAETWQLRQAAGAASVPTGWIPEGDVWAGVPPRRIRSMFQTPAKQQL